MAFTKQDIIELMEQAARLGVSVEITDRDYTLKLDGLCRGAVASTPVAISVPATSAGMAVEPPVAAQPEPAAPPKAAGKIIKSPIVGTFYASPSPDKEAFVSVGKTVKKGDVLFIIESMKLMNEVTSEHDGVVREILAASGQAVEFGQPILVLE